jgi:hypothetical protein
MQHGTSAEARPPQLPPHLLKTSRVRHNLNLLVDSNKFANLKPSDSRAATHCEQDEGAPGAHDAGVVTPALWQPCRSKHRKSRKFLHCLSPLAQFLASLDNLKIWISKDIQMTRTGLVRAVRLGRFGKAKSSPLFITNAPPLGSAACRRISDSL